MKNSQNHDEIILNKIEDTIGKTANKGPPDLMVNYWI